MKRKSIRVVLEESRRHLQRLRPEAYRTVQEGAVRIDGRILVLCSRAIRRAWPLEDFRNSVFIEGPTLLMGSRSGRRAACRPERP
jgi:hypothetical protein